jgi:peptide/nickel transport system substrate-binding protein
VASVYFSSDTANPDTYSHFYCDAEMYQTTMTQPDPGFFMNQFVSWEVATKANKWQGRNISRWQNKEYDELWTKAQHELDAVKRAAMFIQLNDIVCADHYILPENNRPRATALKNGMMTHQSGWDNDLWQIANWYRES